MSLALLDTSSLVYSCPHCLRKYKLSANLQKHVGICQFLQQTRKQLENTAEYTEKVPSMTELFHIVQYLSLRIDKLEKENSALKQHQKKNLNITEWLNEQKENQPTVLFSEWITECLLREVKTCMDILYEQDIYASITALFEKVIGNKEVRQPFCSFDKKKLTFYVYNKSADSGKAEWTQLGDDEFNRLVKRLQARYITEFMKGWYAENEALILENEDLYSTYMSYYEKISKEDNVIKYRNCIYSATKTTIKKVVEYEF